MKRYVLAFAFNAARTHVALIRKRRPVWQAGFLNGLGGKDEPGESPLQAVMREFEEEALLVTEAGDWQHYAELSGPGFVMVVYAAFLEQERFDAITTNTDEQVLKLPVDSPSITRFALPNVPWLIRAALDPDCAAGRMSLTAIYR